MMRVFGHMMTAVQACIAAGAVCQGDASMIAVNPLGEVLPGRGAFAVPWRGWESAHIARLRAAVGHDLLLVPSVTVLPFDEAGRVLLVHHAGHHDGWGAVGGTIEIGESPAQAADRESYEEIGAKVRLVRLLDVLGGPDYQVTYPNGDHTAYVTAVYAAELTGGVLRPDGSEVSALAWFTREELAGLALSRFARAVLLATRHL
jgi:ADP-ribose pyrophosphatase YjhB (NUDIX family)